MQRNMDLVRMVLMKLESSRSGWGADLGIKSFPADEVSYHAQIMMEEGLIKGSGVTPTGSSGPVTLPTGLTWKGHEFLDLARDQERWNRAKAIFAKLGGAPISVWTKVLTDLMLQGVESVTTKTP